MNTRPYKSARRASAAQQTRERIVTAAVTLLGTVGDAHGFSLEAVAKEAGVTRLTVYNQFGSRRALLESVFDVLASQGGLQRIPEAMAYPEPRAGLLHLIAIFCDFWSAHGGAARRVFDAAVHDPELGESLRARNERRRHALSVLVGRMARAGDVAPEAMRDVVDVLFALTSLDFFAQLRVGRRSTSRVCQLIQALAADQVGALTRSAD